MDAIDILGGLLGGKSQGGGLGGQILKDLINPRTRSGSSAAPQTRQTQAPSSRSGSGSPASLEERARELEELLGVAKGRSQSPAQPAPAPQPRYQQPPPAARPRYREPQAAPRSAPQSSGFPQSDGYGQLTPPPSPPLRQGSPFPQNNPMSQNDEALVLVRAMINAAKSDGTISSEEQQAIVERISNPTQETINFLREEFNAPLNVRDFAWSVPLGMEQQVYTMSLASINLDTNPEASYLRDLAHGLRLEPDFCNDLHRRYGASTIF